MEMILILQHIERESTKTNEKLDRVIELLELIARRSR